MCICVQRKEYVSEAYSKVFSLQNFCQKLTQNSWNSSEYDTSFCQFQLCVGVCVKAWHNHSGYIMQTHIIPRTCSLRFKILSICLCATNRISLAIKSPHERWRGGSEAKNFQLAAVLLGFLRLLLCGSCLVPRNEVLNYAKCVRRNRIWAMSKRERGRVPG